MKFGIHLPDAGRDPSREAIIETAITAESLGYSSVWSSDHIAWPTLQRCSRSIRMQMTTAVSQLQEALGLIA